MLKNFVKLQLFFENLVKSINYLFTLFLLYTKHGSPPTANFSNGPNSSFFIHFSPMSDRQDFWAIISFSSGFDEFLAGMAKVVAK